MKHTSIQVYSYAYSLSLSLRHWDTSQDELFFINNKVSGKSYTVKYSACNLHSKDSLTNVTYADSIGVQQFVNQQIFRSRSCAVPM